MLCVCGCGEQMDRYDKRGRERRFIYRHGGGRPKTLPPEKYVCYACGVRECMYIENGGTHDRWSFNHDNEDNMLCHRCWSRYIHSPEHNKIWNPIYSPRGLRFKDKHPMLERNPRVGICNLCRAVVGCDCKISAMDHWWYDDSDPLIGAIETCPSCHMTRHQRLKKFSKLIKPDFSFGLIRGY
jgi:hypothetical protein